MPIKAVKISQFERCYLCVCMCVVKSTNHLKGLFWTDTEALLVSLA